MQSSTDTTYSANLLDMKTKSNNAYDVGVIHVQYIMICVRL